MGTENIARIEVKGDSRRQTIDLPAEKLATLSVELASRCGDISLEKRRRPREYGMKGLVDQARIDTGVCREGDLMGVSEREIQLFQYLAGRFS